LGAGASALARRAAAAPLARGLPVDRLVRAEVRRLPASVEARERLIRRGFPGARATSCHSVGG
jgi:hypothetical protein